MACSLVEQHIESAVRDAFGDKAMHALKRVDRIAAKQGGENAAANYRLLGKRALIAVGVVFVGVQVVTSIAGLVISRASEERRVERIVRRVLAEERAQLAAAEEVPCEAE